jgi:hypothetical protein
MQKLIENALAKQEEEASGFKVVHFSRKGASEKKQAPESILAEEVSKKQTKKMLKEEQHVGI